MTFKQYARKYLEENGIWIEKQREAILDYAQTSNSANPELKTVWNDIVEGYPDMFKAAFIYSLRRITVEWIDANLPKAFYRSVFTD